MNKISSSTPYIIWKPEYSVGLDILDGQHCVILQLINDLYTNMRLQQPSLDIRLALETLVTYTKTHFSTEEGFLRKWNYPGYPEHNKAHERMAQITLSFSAQYLQSREDLQREMFLSLKNWWLTHILDEDMKYKTYSSQVIHGD